MKKYKNLWFWFIAVSLLSFYSVYHYMTLLPQEAKLPEKVAVFPQVQQVIKKETTLYLREQYNICQKYGLSCTHDIELKGQVRLDLNGITQKELEERYPTTAGWKIKWQDSIVVLEHTKPGLCPEHMKRWHLYPDENGERVAVYLGPSVIGTDGGLVQRTYIKIEKLPLKIQEKIINGTLEFLQWEDLVATLDSLDEY